MSVTLTQLQNNVLSRLNESGNTSAGELDSGTGGAATIATTATLTQYINNACAHLCKTCVALQDTATYTYPTGSLTVPFSAFTTVTGGKLWAVRTAKWNGAQLTKAESAYIELGYPSLESDSNGTPLHFYQNGQFAVGLAPKPSADQTLSVTGFITPVALATGSDTASWIDDDEAIYIEFYAAYMIAMKNTEDPTLIQKVNPWKMEFESAKARLWTRLLQTDPGIAKGYFSAPQSVPLITDANG